MSLACGIIADDFTGAMLVAAYCETAGVACPVFFSPDALLSAHPETRLAILATRSRLARVEDARSQIEIAIDAFAAAGAQSIAYKACGTFDSTEEGNIGLAADLLLEHFDQSVILLSAGFPDYGTTVHQGHMFLGNQPINESDKRLDPITPMPDANLVRFLSHQTSSHVGLVSHLEMSRGKSVAQATLETRIAEGFRHILCDLSDDTDLAMSLSLTESARSVVASDPLVIAFALERARSNVTTLPAPCHKGGPAALFVGSVGSIAKDQIAAFEAIYPVLHLDLLEDITEAELIARATDWATARIGDTPFGMTTWTDTDRLKRIQAKLGSLAAARKAERLLSAIAINVHAMGVRRILVGGGETSGAIVSALGLQHVRALPLGTLRGGLCITEGDDPVSLYLKSGKLGDRDIFLHALEIMRP